MSDRQNPPDASPPGSDPADRTPRGHEGETAWDASGSVAGRLKHPVGTGGEPRPEGMEGTGAEGHEPLPGREEGHGVRVDSYRPTDSRIEEAERGQPATSYVGGRGFAEVEVQRPHPEEVDRRKERRAEFVIATWFLISVVGTIAFVIVNFQIDTHEIYYTPLLGASMATALTALGIGLVLWTKRLMPHEEAVQEREPHFSRPEELAGTEETAARGFHEVGIGRRPIVRRTLLLSAGALGLLGIVPLLNFGQLIGRKPNELYKTSWGPGVRMIDQNGNPIRIGDIAAGGLLTVFPAIDEPGGAEEESGEGDVEGVAGEYPRPTIHTKADSTAIIIRLRAGELTGRYAEEAFEGHIVFSKICTHAGCPVSLYEQQTHHLLCPCHQSVFDVLEGGRPIFGPAARSLPRLRIGIDDEGYFVAQGDFAEPIGPSFWERG